MDRYCSTIRKYPFEGFRKFGKRFAAHFRLKLLKAENLHNLALIDTPGMLDSVSERDRGYDYQEVVGDLAQIADLILIIFDPHKAGTIREVYQSLRETLPRKSFEDRVMFVLNRIDECAGIDDLLRVYGTLCWNLSQMTGRKDIPAIHITWSDAIYSTRQHGAEHEFMRLLHNQRTTIKDGIFSAPRHRLDNLAGYIELHSERIAMLLTALLAFVQRRRVLGLKCVAFALLPALLVTLLFYLMLQGVVGDYLTLGIMLAVIALGSGGAVWWFIRKWLVARFHRRLADEPDTLVTLTDQAATDRWEAVREAVQRRLRSATDCRRTHLKKELKQIKQVRTYSAAEVRKAIAEYENIRT